MLCFCHRFGLLFENMTKIVLENVVKNKLVKVVAGHILDLYCVQLLNTAPFGENYTKLYFDAKHLEKGLNREGKFLGAFLLKKVPFLANTECCPKFLEYALTFMYWRSW